MQSGIKSVEWTAPPYEATITIPESFSGTTSMSAMALDFVNPRSGTSATASITFRVVPAGSPVQIWVPNRHITLLLNETPADSELIYVSGKFANGQHYELDYPGAGTTFQSLDPAIATVDASGLVTAIVGGKTFLKIQNGTLIQWASVWVRWDKPLVPLPAVNQTTNVTISGGAFHLERDGRAYAQQVLITNVSAVPIHKPLALVLEDVPPSVKVLWHLRYPETAPSSMRTKPAEATKTITPLGSPVVNVFSEDFEKDMGWLAPGDSATLEIRFANPSGVPFTYTPKLYTATEK
jgi:hypothetical protein